MSAPSAFSIFFFFNDTATTEIYTLSLHDALPISDYQPFISKDGLSLYFSVLEGPTPNSPRSEEHTSELQSQSNLVCRLLLEKKKKSQTQSHALLPTHCAEPPHKSIAAHNSTATLP